VSETAEIIKAALTSWPAAMIVIVLILRALLRAVIERIKNLKIGHGDTKAEIEIGPEIAKVAPLDNEQARTGSGAKF
jgi:hypothetical protein